ncbi:MAG TPA: hypothetical protein ENN43_03480, partial [bacterium]|nr:hypothetical protein [bacterium]
MAKTNKELLMGPGRLGLLFACLSLLFFSGSFYEVYQLPKAFAMAAALLFGFGALIISRATIKISAPALFLLLFQSYLLLSLIFTKNNPPPHYSLTLFAPCLFFLAAGARVNRNKFLAFILCLAAASSLFSLFQSASGMPRPHSFFGNPVFSAEFTAITLPLLAALLIRNRRLRPAAAAVVFISLFSLFLSASRGVALAFFLSSAFFAAYLIRPGAVPGFSARKTLK